MMADKLTDKEIIKALECCSKNPNTFICTESDCPLFGQNCSTVLSKNALDLIKRQQAEIERLSDRNRKCIYLSDEETTEYCVDGPCPKFKTVGQIKAEAIKEFAERLKELKEMPLITNNDIDNLVKEIVGEQE